MAKAVLISAHIPNPRINKRIESLSTLFEELTVIYWNRDHGYNFSVEPVLGVKYNSLEGTNQRRLFRRYSETRRLTKATYEMLAAEKPDCIYVSGIEGMFPAKKYKEKRKVKIILELGDLPATSYKKYLRTLHNKLELFLNNLVSQADGLVLTSQYFYLDYYKRTVGFKEENTFIFENVPRKAIFQDFQKQAHKGFTIGFVGGVRYFDSLRTLFEACSGEANLNVLVAGKGPDYERVLDESKKYANVKVTGPYNYTKDILRIYSTIDLVYSVYDTHNLNERIALPNRLYEAIVCETPIIASENTRLGKYVKDLGVGFTVSDNNVNELRDIIRELSRNPILLQEASANASRIKEKFYYEHIEENFGRWLRKRTGLRKM